MTYHSLRGNNLITRARLRAVLLFVGIFLYGCAVATLTWYALEHDTPYASGQPQPVQECLTTGGE